jgi:hypothetical protein
MATLEPRSDLPHARRARTPFLPAASGAQCACALRKAGFTVQKVDTNFTTLVRDDLALRVPFVDAMCPGLLLAVLRAARITPAEFVGHLVS